MPRKKAKQSKTSARNEVADVVDTASVVSLNSEGSDTINVHAEVEEAEVIQNILEVNVACDLLSEKRPTIRENALAFILESFRMNNFTLTDSWNYTSTFLDGIENVLKRGRPEAQTLAAGCLSVFVLQYDPLCLPECFCKFFPILDQTIRDNSANRAFRASSVTALALMQFLSGNCDFVSVIELMKSFEVLFRGSCLKGDGKAQQLDPSLSALHVSALCGWTLLYTSLIPHDAITLGKSLMPTLVSLLQGNDVEMRISAGETAALIYERLRLDFDERYKGPHYTDLVRLLKELANDSTKSRSKIDRRRQRQSFRDFNESIANFTCTDTSINFGSEVLTLSSCSTNFYYSFLCSLLKGGLHRHLRENCQVRTLFSLGLPVLVHSESLADRKVHKHQRRQAMAVVSKARSQNLSTHRDRRSNLTIEVE